MMSATNLSLLLIDELTDYLWFIGRHLERGSDLLRATVWGEAFRTRQVSDGDCARSDHPERQASAVPLEAKYLGRLQRVYQTLLGLPPPGQI